MTKPVRVRFAPSPTGPLHIGGVRTALFNYLFAKKHKGTFYIRIEDTDQSRYVEGAEDYIFEALKWLGISPDETIGKNEKFPPYRQSDRKAMYKKYADELIEKGAAYYAFDTAESLDEKRKACEKEGKTFIYNHTTRESLDNSLGLSKDEIARRVENEEYVVRFKMPENRTIVLHDLIRGEVSFETSLLDDKVLFKSDGMPTYHLANIVDDHLQETSHVIRGEEWLPSLPLHYLLYEAFGWDCPEFAHLPLILKPVGNGKLSKRDGDKYGFPVFPLEWKATDGAISMGYREQGFLPEAVINFLVLLGWNDGTDKELFSLEELSSIFDIERVVKSGAKFDPEKNKWFNHQYIQQQSNEEIYELIRSQFESKGLVFEKNHAVEIIDLVKERAFLLTDFYELMHYFYQSPEQLDEKATKKWNEQTATVFGDLIDLLNAKDISDSSEYEQTIKEWIKEKELPMGKVLQPLRVAMVGSMQGPDLFHIMSLIGKEEVIKRIKKALSFFENK